MLRSGAILKALNMAASTLLPWLGQKTKGAHFRVTKIAYVWFSTLRLIQVLHVRTPKMQVSKRYFPIWCRVLIIC